MGTKAKLMFYRAADKLLQASPEIVDKTLKIGVFIGSLLLFKNATKIAKPLRYAGKIKPVGKVIAFAAPIVPMFIRNFALGVNRRTEEVSSRIKGYIRKRADAYRMEKIAPKIEGLMKLRENEKA